MKRTGTFIFSLLVTKMVLARDEIGPEGDKLIYVGLVVLLILLFLVLAVRKKGGKSNEGKPLFWMKNVEVMLEKDRLYFPDRLKLSIINKGNRDIDHDVEKNASTENGLPAPGGGLIPCRPTAPCGDGRV